jgi:hypothetical protein
MPWHHIYAPTKGMITNIPSTLLPKEASPYIKGLYLKDGEAISDFGHTDYPVTGNTTTNELNGSFTRKMELPLSYVSPQPTFINIILQLQLGIVLPRVRK